MGRNGFGNLREYADGVLRQRDTLQADLEGLKDLLGGAQWDRTFQVLHPPYETLRSHAHDHERDLPPNWLMRLLEIGYYGLLAFIAGTWAFLLPKLSDQRGAVLTTLAGLAGFGLLALSGLVLYLWFKVAAGEDVVEPKETGRRKLKAVLALAGALIIDATVMYVLLHTSLAIASLGAVGTASIGMYLLAVLSAIAQVVGAVLGWEKGHVDAEEVRWRNEMERTYGKQIVEYREKSKKIGFIGSELRRLAGYQPSHVRWSKSSPSP